MVSAILVNLFSHRISRHESGSKLRQNSSTHKLVDDDGNVVLVVCNATNSNFYNCSIINEIAENSTSCQVITENCE